MNPDYKRALVLGLGESGEAAAQLLLDHHVDVTIVDAADTDRTQSVADAMRSFGAHVVLGSETLPNEKFDVAIVSPGVPLESLRMKQLRHRLIPCIPEIELGAMLFKGKILAITGTNGKSTCTKLCCEALQRQGFRADACGNYGKAVCRSVKEDASTEVLVVETSSFQLETVLEYKPDVAVLLNLSPNHLNRHGDMETYLETKVRIFSNQDAACIGVVPEDLSGEIQRRSAGEGRWVTFGSSMTADYRYTESGVIAKDESVLSLQGTPFDGPVLGQNAAAVTAALMSMGVTPEHITDAMLNFKPLPHRLEKIGTHRRVNYINDSKATSLAAVEAALLTVGGGIHLIAGGESKEHDFSSIKELLKDRVIAIYLVGKDAEKMATSWSGICPCHQCGTLDRAVETAAASAQANETVLLSPGCASFDQFRNFQERGETFRKLFNRMINEEAA